MTFRQAAFLSSAGLLAILVAAGFVLGLMSFDESTPHPTDKALEQTFVAHEVDFNKLVSMCNSDPHVVRIAPTFTWLDNNAAWPRPESELGFSTERWDEYRSLFSKLGLTAGVINDPPGFVMFLASTRGLVTGGSSKGYWYSLKPPEKIVDSLDNMDFSKSRIAYKRLKGNWYLFYMAD